MHYKYTQQQLQEACETSMSYRQVMSKLGLREAGGNYQTIKKRIKQYEIDISHFTHNAWNQGSRYRMINKPKPTDELLIDNPYSSAKLRLRLLREGYFEYKCYKCQLTIWNNTPIPLELEHIDGDHSNNKLENLTLLCPNCHAQTPTYRRRKSSLGSVLPSALPVKVSPNLTESL